MKQIVLVSNPLEDRSCAGCVFGCVEAIDGANVCDHSGLAQLCTQGDGDYIFVEVNE